MVSSADLFKEEGEHLLFLERIFRFPCTGAPLSPKAALESQGSRRAEDTSHFGPPGFSYLKEGVGAARAPPQDGWAGKGLWVLSLSRGTGRDESILSLPDHAASLKMLLEEHP